MTTIHGRRSHISWVMRTKIEKLHTMKKGWFIGNFSPTIFDTNECEVAIKHYKKGDHEKSHYHKIAREFTAIINGQAKMQSIILDEGDIVEISPGESTDFIAISDVSTVVIKIPCVKDDKYFDSE
jgi:hypothetical protein